jgi:hypothetical protein
MPNTGSAGLRSKKRAIPESQIHHGKSMKKKGLERTGNDG